MLYEIQSINHKRDDWKVISGNHFHALAVIIREVDGRKEESLKATYDKLLYSRKFDKKEGEEYCLKIYDFVDKYKIFIEIERFKNETRKIAKITPRSFEVEKIKELLKLKKDVETVDISGIFLLEIADFLKESGGFQFKIFKN